ncbi:acyltransferase [Collinsella sp. TF06-6AC]|nr:acyltransferase [Collinsella aerofaciens]RGL40325.1 acyltransferase [Collinsella sp. TF06-6AC]
MTGPSTILTHDYSWGVIKGKTGEVLGNQKHVTIGNNIFIGWGATILCGTTIEDNVIVGAHSVVSGRLEHDSVYAGVPAKKVCSLECYREKRASAQLEEAKDYVVRFRRRFGRDPRADEMREYFFLWATPDRLNDSYVFQMSLMGTYDKSEAILATPRQFNSFEQFLAYCDNAEVE